MINVRPHSVAATRTSRDQNPHMQIAMTGPNKHRAPITIPMLASLFPVCVPPLRRIRRRASNPITMAGREGRAKIMVGAIPTRAQTRDAIATCLF
jgi:hypothetical protein